MGMSAASAGITRIRRLNDSVAVKAPSNFALAYINTYFLERGPQGTADLALRFPLPKIFIEGLTLEKSVSLKLEYGARNGGSKPVLIGWEPIGTNALPSFSGTLTAPEETDITCRLVIEGEYAPPGGLIGSVFDQLIGVRIARATLDALLAQFALAIDADYAARSYP